MVVLTRVPLTIFLIYVWSTVPCGLPLGHSATPPLAPVTVVAKKLQIAQVIGFAFGSPNAGCLSFRLAGLSLVVIVVFGSTTYETVEDWLACYVEYFPWWA